MTNNTLENDVESTSTNRRSMMSGLAVAAAGLAASSLLTPSVSKAVTPALTYADIPGTGDVKVLNYALALEDLESDLYSQVFQRLTIGGHNALGTKLAGMNLNFGNIDVYYVHRYGAVETAHSNFLRGALGSQAITRYKHNFGIEKMSRKQMIELIYTAESLGTSAYLGAVPLFTTKTYLPVAGAITGVEGRHVAVFARILNQLFNDGKNTAPLTSAFGDSSQGRDKPMTPDQVLAAVSPYIVV